MPIDIVVDTNVLKQADDDLSNYQEICITLIEYLMYATESLCIDEGISYSIDGDNGFIGREYVKYLRPGMQGYNLILRLISKDRISFLSRDVPAPILNKINRTGIKKSDRNFVRVAYNSEEKILITHDYTDFHDKNRRIFRREIGVRVIDADQYI